MERFQGILGIIAILGIAFLFSNNKKKINLRLVISGLGLQLFLAIIILKIPAVTRFFQAIGGGMKAIEGYAQQGAAFVYGGIMTDTHSPAGPASYGAPGTFIFAFSIPATIILVCVLVAILYHVGIM